MPGFAGNKSAGDGPQLAAVLSDLSAFSGSETFSDWQLDNGGCIDEQAARVNAGSVLAALVFWFPQVKPR